MTYPGIGPDGVYRLHDGLGMGGANLRHQLEQGGNVLVNHLEEVEDDSDSSLES